MNISFFIASFSSIFWLFYSLKFVNISRFSATGGTEALFQTVVIVLFPIAVIWGILVAIKNYYAEKYTTIQNQILYEQLKKNAENANTLTGALIAAEKEMKSGFILQKFDTLIADANEILSDIIKRSNSISSAQMEHLWNRTSGGERWLIAKTFIETYNFQSGFTEHLLQKAQKDSLLRGSILEFETRIKSLYNLLETHDTQRIFYNMVEYGALGKVYGIIAPIAEKLALKTNSTQAEDYFQNKYSRQNRIEEKPSFIPEELSLSPRQEDNFPSFLSRPEETSPSFSRSEPSLKKAEETSTHSEPVLSPADERKLNIDAGLRAIRNEILSPETYASDNTLAESKEKTVSAPVIKSFSLTQTALHNLKNTPVFSDTSINTGESTSLKSSAESQSPIIPPHREISIRPEKPAVSSHTKHEQKNKKVITLDELEKEIESSPDNNYDEYAYPFGAWLDDKNHM